MDQSKKVKVHVECLSKMVSFILGSSYLTDVCSRVYVSKWRHVFYLYLKFVFGTLTSPLIHFPVTQVKKKPLISF